MKNNVSKFITAVLVLIGYCALLHTPAVSAHEVRPSFLSMEETANNQFSVLWKRPVKKWTVPDINPVFPDNCQLAFNKFVEITAAAKIQRGTLTCNDKGMDQGVIRITGLETTLIDVLVRIQLLNGDTVQRVIKRDKPYLVLAQAKGVPIADYITLGFEHIMGGIDHLLFVLALMLIVPGMLALLKTITAFTLAHSITLGLATLGFVNLSAPPVEACIALSIILMAAHALYLKKGKTTLSSGKPWVMAFLFGLLHGLGFAGALNDVGLPEGDIPLALLLFNVGIELGQIAFVLAVAACVYFIKKLTRTQPQTMFTTTAYGIGSMGVYWFIQNSLGIMQ